MKSILLILAALMVTPAAFACPTMNGTYNCKSPDGQGDEVKVKTSKVGKVFVYTVDGMPITADGKTRTYQGDGVKLKLAATCNAKKVSIKQKLYDTTKFDEISQYYCQADTESVNSVSTITPAKGKYTTVTKTVLVCKNGKKVPFDDKQVCTKK